MSEDDENLQITPANATTKTPKKPRVKKELTPEYVSNLKKGRELLLVKKAEQRLKLEEEAITAKTEELRKLKNEPIPDPVPVPVAPVPVPEPVVVAPVKAKAQRKPRPPKEPKERVVEKIVEVEKIVYQAPKLNFCFV